MKLNSQIISYIVIGLLIVVLAVNYITFRNRLNKLQEESLKRVTELNKSQQEIIQLQTKIDLLAKKEAELDSVISLKDLQLKEQQLKFNTKYNQYIIRQSDDKKYNMLIFSDSQRDTLRAKYIPQDSSN